MWTIALWTQTSCWPRTWNASVTAWWICTPTSARWAVAVSQITHWALYSSHSSTYTLHHSTARALTTYYTEYLRIKVWQWGWVCVRAGCDQRDCQLIIIIIIDISMIIIFLSMICFSLYSTSLFTSSNWRQQSVLRWATLHHRHIHDSRVWGLVPSAESEVNCSENTGELFILCVCLCV